MIDFIKKAYNATQSLLKTKFAKLQKQQPKNRESEDIIMKHLENIKVDTKKFYNPAIKQHMSIEEIREELERRYSISEKGINCMIPNKYSREYTDYYLNQLAEFFGFDFFHNKKEKILSNLKENQCFRSMREILSYETEKSCSPKSRLTSVRSAVDTARIYTKNCEDGEKSKHAFQDMMFFDSFIMNNKRNIDNFGFIVDREKKNKFGNDLRYSFVCFYDEYNSMFDHLNGITTLEDYDKAIMNVESWTDNEWHREYADDLGPRFGRFDHIEKLKELSLLTGSFKFKDNEQFQLDEYHLFVHEYIKQNIEYPISVYQYRLHECSDVWPDRLEYNIGLNEILNNKEKLENQLERSKNYDPEKKEKEIPEEQKHLYKIWLEDKFYWQMWRNTTIRPKLE